MIEVDKDTFYKAIGGPENIHPHSERTETIWEDQHTRRQVGRSEPGFFTSGPLTPKRYWLTDDFATRKGVRP